MNNFGLLVDRNEKKIIDPTTLCTKTLETPNSEINLAINDNIPDPSRAKLVLPNTRADSEYNEVYHRTDTGSHPPIYANVRILPEEKKQKQKKQKQYARNLKSYKQTV